MSESWTPATAAEVKVGDRVRMRGHEILVSRIEPNFLGRDGMIAFIEDTPERWFKAPAPGTAEVEVQRPA